jgi:predicted Zn-dependent protease
MRPARALQSIFAILLFAVPALAQSPALAEKAQHAKELMAAGRPGEAVPIYRELVRALPGNPGLILNLGLALDMSGDKRAAIRQYQAALKLQADFFAPLLLMGTAYLDLGQPSLAVAPLEKAVELQPENFEAQVTLAEAELALERFGAAASRFQKLSQQDSSSAKVWYGLGACYEGLAQKSFDELAEAAPGSAYWLDLVAESRLETKQTYSAFYFYKQALAKMPGLRGVHAALAEIYKETDHADWAVTEEAKEKQLPPPDCGAEKLECESQAGNLLGVVQDATHDPAALYWKTRAYNQLALGAYDRLGRLPPSLETHELRARIESRRRQSAEAAKEWREALNLAPGNPYVKRELAIALSESGSLPEARKLFQELLQQDPNSGSLNYLLGDVILSAQEPQEAIPYLQKAVAADPQFLPAQKSLGLAYLQMSQTEKAIPLLKAALPADQDGSLHYQLGRAYQAHGDRDLAREMFRTYQEMQSKNQEENRGLEKDVAITPP